MASQEVLCNTYTTLKFCDVSPPPSEKFCMNPWYMYIVPHSTTREMQALWGEPERVCGCCSCPHICGRTNIYVRGCTYVNSARNLRSLLRCRASSRWAVDCAARRALSLTLRLASRASLSSALSKAQFLRSRSLLRLSLASLLSCPSHDTRTCADRGQRLI